MKVGTVVVGAGFSGLACAVFRGGDDTLVVEGASRAGGLVRTAVEDGLRLELGPEALSGAAHDVRALAEELGVAVREAPAGASKRYVVLRGELVEVPLSPPKLVTSRLLSPLAKLRLATEPFRARGRALDGSIADFARHRLGRQVLERLMDPMVSGIHAGDPEELSLRACFPAVAAMVEEHGSLFAALRARARGGDRPPGLWKPAGGMQALTDAAAGRLGTRLRLGAAVRSLARDGDVWRVGLDGDEEYRARHVVLAVPLAAARTLLREVAPEAADALATMRCESLAAVYLAWPRARVVHPLDGFGYLVPAVEGRDHLGTLFSSSIDPACAPADTALLRVMVGGARRPELLALDDATLLERVVADVRPLLGLAGAPTRTHVERWGDALPRFDLAHPARWRAVEAALPAGLTVLGNFTRGIGLSSLASAARGAR